jgi:hypothetical protein
MATLVLQYAGSALGSLIGGPIGATLGRAAGALAGNVLDNLLFAKPARRVEGPRLKDLAVMASQEGSPIPRVWGRMRVAGQVIWATRFEEVISTRTEKAGGKGTGGGPKTKITEYSYFANVAVALAEGEVARVGRVWADGKEFDLSGLTTRFYPGSDTQLPDSLIVAKEGAGNAPAYRGLSYIVFERLPLARFGNRLPQLSFEVVRPIAGAADHVRAVNLIPGSTEFGYDPQIVTRDEGGGVTASENAHLVAGKSDVTASLDQLQAACKNLQSVSLVVSWFGDDLRCGQCQLRPGVETAAKTTRPESWSVSGATRTTAHLVSTVGGKPAFGGTPSDASVVRAIQNIKARGLKAVFYPFILMDMAAPAYPWRGRITCDPAPGQPGSPDKTPAAGTQLQAFLGTAQPSHFAISGTSVTYSGPAEWSYRRMILHYAKLCAAAGGVDAFLIGSELRGLTTLRDGPSSYPFVAALVTLAAEVKAILPTAKISYAADWSEYFGHHPQDGSNDVFFHLDPLWASSAIDFIGIDNYMPLADWRDGANHLDALAGHCSIYDLAYLKSNIMGGEGFDWFYANQTARDAQTRTPIADTAYGKPWVFRYKDLKSWWSNPHRNRPGGVESPIPTAWAPQSKPIRFTEAGCPAIDKGANQPNVFVDTKSSESALPYYSKGTRDDAMQHAYIRALSEYWTTPGPHNPISSAYGSSMVDAAATHVWAWDARPFPAFPRRADLWADAENYARGHWLNGRIESVPLASLIATVCAEYGFTAVASEGIHALVDGAIADRILSARDILDPLSRSFAFDAVESEGFLKFRARNLAQTLQLTRENLVELNPDQPLYMLTRAQETELPAAVKLAYAESGIDYRIAAVEARKAGTPSIRETVAELPCAVASQAAQQRVDVMLAELWAGRETISFALPKSATALEASDVIALDLGTRTHLLRLEEIADGEARRIKARLHEPGAYDAEEGPARNAPLPESKIYGPPLTLFMDLPLAGDTVTAEAPWIAATASPWPGSLNVLKREGSSTFVLDRSIDAPAVIGELLDPLPAGPIGRFDRASTVKVKLYGGALSSVSEGQLLAGANAAAIGGEASGWEILQFRDATLVAAKTYELSWLLRGQNGSEPEMLSSRPAGTRFVLLDPSVIQPGTALADVGRDIAWRIGPSPRDHGDPAYVELMHRPKGLGLRPLSPAHLRVRPDGGDAVFTWTRRTRSDGDGWDLPDVPLGEEQELYDIEVMDSSIVKRTVRVATPSWRYAAADQLADFGLPQTAFTLRISQVSLSFGRGSILERMAHV